LKEAKFGFHEGDCDVMKAARCVARGQHSFYMKDVGIILYYEFTAEVVGRI